jgi:hypothetical protein
MHDKGFALLRRELRKRAGDIQSKLALLDERRWTIGAIQQRLCVDESQMATAGLFQVIETPIAERLKQPGAKAARIAAFLEIGVRANECVLHHVGSRIMIEHHSHRMPIQGTLVSLDDDGVVIGVTGENTRDDVGIDATVLTDRFARVSHQLTINTAT